eukprot:1139077-Pelagomonas_calceolata.AAC.3
MGSHHSLQQNAPKGQWVQSTASAAKCPQRPIDCKMPMGLQHSPKGLPRKANDLQKDDGIAARNLQQNAPKGCWATWGCPTCIPMR